MAAKKDTPAPITPDEKRAALIDEWAETADRIDADLARIAAIKAELEELPAGQKYAGPSGRQVAVTQGSTFKPERVVQQYPPTTAENVQRFYKLVPDVDKVKRALPGAEVDAFYAKSKPSVKLV